MSGDERYAKLARKLHDQAISLLNLSMGYWLYPNRQRPSRPVRLGAAAELRTLADQLERSE